MSHKLPYLLIALLFISSCNKSYSHLHDVLSLVDSTIITKSGLDGASSNVTELDINAYIHFKYLASNVKAYSVTPYTDGVDTLLYIINYADGWELVSGDKRTPVLLGHSSEGKFSLNSENEEMLCWVDCLASDVKMLKLKEDFSSYTEDDLANMNASRLFWSLVCCEGDVINSF